LESALDAFELALPCRARAFDDDTYLGITVTYDRDFFMEIAGLGAGLPHVVRFTGHPEGEATILLPADWTTNDGWLAKEDRATLALYRVFDPRTFRGLIDRAVPRHPAVWMPMARYLMRVGNSLINRPAAPHDAEYALRYRLTDVLPEVRDWRRDLISYNGASGDGPPRDAAGRYFRDLVWDVVSREREVVFHLRHGRIAWMQIEEIFSSDHTIRLRFTHRTA